MRRAFGVFAVIVTCGLAGCGESPVSSTPTSVSFTDPFAGTWVGTTTPVFVSGGECVGDDLRASKTTLKQGTLTITQNASGLSATMQSETGLSCRYDGSASPTTFRATAVTCDTGVLFKCSNGDSRVLRPIASTLSATQNGITASGTISTSYNIFSVDLTTNRETPVAGMAVDSQFTAVRR